MTLAILTDIHGNSDALAAVLQDISSHYSVDEYLVLGDLVAEGPDPLGVVQRLTILDNLSCILGNTDRWVIEGYSELPLKDNCSERHLQVVTEISRTCGWTAGVLTSNGWFDWLAELPSELRRTLPDGRRLLAVHGSPGSDEIPMTGAKTTPEEMQERLRGSEADIVLAGHTHLPFRATVDGADVYTIGSVSLPGGEEKGAQYALLEATEAGYTLEMKKVPYDFSKMLELARRIRHPSLEYMSRFFTRS
jgi:predicted phosphodiesterase